MKERHLGIDMLRILSMYLVLVLHILGQGGVMKGLDVLSLKYKAVWLLEIAAYCSVNCYALITGYVSVNSKLKYSRIITLWFQVVFYTLFATVCFKMIRPGAVWSGAFISALMPVTHVQYWYFTAYFGMFFFIPYLNILILKLDKNQFKTLIITLIILFSVIPTLFQADLFSLSSGYSMTWLIILYFIGAYIKIHGFGKDRGKFFYLSVFFILVLFTWCSKFIQTGLKYNPNMFISYTSPFIVGTAICLFLFCSKIHFKGKFPVFIISTFTSASFGVYLIHTNPLVWELLLNGSFKGFASLGTFPLLVAIIAAALAVYITCSLVDLLRASIFRLVRLNTLSDNIERVIYLGYNKIFNNKVCDGKHR